MNRRSLSITAGLTLGALIALGGPRYFAAGTYSNVGNYSYGRVGTWLFYQGPTQGYRGHDVQLGAVLYDRDSGQRIRDALIRFSIGPVFRWDRTNKDGRASAVLPLDELAPRTYQVSVLFAGNDFYKPNQTSRSFKVRWEHQYFDDAGAGRINLNPSTQEFQFESPEETGDIEHAPRMRVVAAGGQRLLTLTFDDGETTVVGEFDLDSGLFAALVNTPHGTYALEHSAAAERKPPAKGAKKLGVGAVDRKASRLSQTVLPA
jgi:hypothetical protein